MSAIPADVIFTMVRRADWQRAERLGRYEGSDDDRADGFLHFSTAAQLAESAHRHRRGEADLLLVAVEVSRLGTALKWEHAATRNDRFPHLYAPLEMGQALWVKPLPLGADGLHVFPAEVPLVVRPKRKSPSKTVFFRFGNPNHHNELI